MRKPVLVLLLGVMLVMLSTVANAQCSICTKTASQLGDKQARGLNSGIVYLMLTPFAIAGYIGYRWWQNENEESSEVE